MNHLPILPFLLPFLAATLLLLAHRAPLAAKRSLSLATAAIAGAASMLLVLQAADGTIAVYALGNWPAPYGILFVSDQLAAMLVLLLFVLAIPVLVAVCGGVDQRGPHFHALFQLQLAGIAGAFLTGDIFNLFVCFEILLLASYALLVHSGGFARIRAGLPYVILNLVGSTIFLVAIAILYGTLGTLNLADIATRLPAVPAQDVPLVRTGFLLLILVFLLKAAVLPMAFWLPHVYASATPPVAALFAIMTKVGIVALLRLSVIGFGTSAVGDDLLMPWLPALALLTIGLGTAGAFAARRFTVTVANLILVSSGTLIFALSAGTPDATAALLYYLPHSTLVTGGLFLLAGAISIRRGEFEDKLIRGPVIANKTALSLAFALFAVSVSGLPPLSGFIGKVMLMQGTGSLWQLAWWAALLLSGLGVALVFARAGSILFWEPEGYASSAVSDNNIGPMRTTGVTLLCAASPLLVVFANPIAAYAQSASRQLHARDPYISAVLQADRTIQREVRPSAPPNQGAPQ